MEILGGVLIIHIPHTSIIKNKNKMLCSKFNFNNNNQLIKRKLLLLYNLHVKQTNINFIVISLTLITLIVNLDNIRVNS